MNIAQALIRVRDLRQRLRASSPEDALALTILMAERSPSAYPNHEYPNDGRDGAQIIADAGMNDMGK
jgi:hypothetical protein